MTRRITSDGERRLLTRDEFREGVFARDGHLCVLCRSRGVTTPAADAHHILERRLWTQESERHGYLLPNGASVCEPCHLLCEQTVVSVEEVREAAGISEIVLPSHLYGDYRYTKWGDPTLPNGMRMKGELFHDESVQKVLRQGRVLDLYTHLVRFPRTFHVPWSGTINDDDEVLQSLAHFEGREIVVTVKRDGQNNTIYPTGELHARAPDGRSHPDQAMARAEAAKWQFDLPEGWRVCAESLYRRHSIAYADLPAWLLGFHVWAESWTDPSTGQVMRNVCLPWRETLEWFALLGVTPVETIYQGPFDERILKAIRFDRERMEGWVVRDAGPILYGQYGTLVAKYVRPGHLHLHGARNAAIVENAIGPAGPQPWRIDERALGPLAESVRATGALVA